MKKVGFVSAILTASILFVSCAGSRKGNDVRQDDKISVMQYSLDDNAIDSALKHIEEILGWYYDEYTEADPEKVLSSISREPLESSEFDRDSLLASLRHKDKATLDSAALVWQNMTGHLRNRRYKDAYDLYMTKYGDLLVHLVHSSSRFTFLQEIGWPLIREFEHPDSAIVTYCNQIALEYWMQIASIQFSSADNPYIPDVLPHTIREYGMVLSKIGRVEEALEMADTLLETLIALGFDEMHANTERAIYGASVMYSSGNLNEAIWILIDLKKMAEGWLTEDVVDDPECEEYYQYYIDKLDKEIERYLKEADYVSVYGI